MKIEGGKAADRAAERSPRDQRDRRRRAESALNPRKRLVKEQLVNAAAEIFAAKGYGNTNMADIAQALGLGRSAIYHYFRNKVDILRALVEQEALQPYTSLNEIARQPDVTPAERLRRAVVDFVLRRLTGGARLIVLNRLEWEMPKDVEALYTRGRRQILDIFVRLITEGIEAGDFSPLDPKIAAFTVLGMANWTSRWYSPAGKKSAKEIADIIATFAVAGLQGVGRRHDVPDSIGGTIKLLKQNLEILERLAE